MIISPDIHNELNIFTALTCQTQVHLTPLMMAPFQSQSPVDSLVCLIGTPKWTGVLMPLVPPVYFLPRPFKKKSAVVYQAFKIFISQFYLHVRIL